MKEEGELKFSPKPLEDLSDFEISNLTEGEIARHRAFAAMVAGVALPPEPAPLPPKPELEKMIVHKITIGNASDAYARDVELVFSSLDDAVDVAQAIRRATPALLKSVYLHNLSTTTTAPATEVSVSSVEISTRESLDRMKTELENWSSLSKTFDDATKKLADARKKLADETKWISEKIASAREKATTVYEVRRTFAQYLDLASGDVETAKRFLRNAYTREELEIEAKWGDGESISALDSAAAIA